MAGLQLPFGLDPTNPVHADMRMGENGTYWASVAAAKAGVPIALRPLGLEVNVLVSGKIVQYWWQAGIQDADLVIKSIGSTGAVFKKGSFNATSGIVTYTDGTPTGAIPAPSADNNGWYFVVTTAGTYASIPYDISDLIVSDGTTYVKIDNTDTVKSVAGKTGAVTLTAADIANDPTPSLPSTNMQDAINTVKTAVDTVSQDAITLKIYKFSNFR